VIRRLSASAPVGYLSDVLGKHNLDLVIVPASDAPDPRDRSVCSAWIDPEKRRLLIGILPSTDAPTVVRTGARVLWMAEHFPDPINGTHIRRVIIEAMIESYALSFCVQAEAHGAVYSALKAFLLNLARNPPSEEDLFTAAAHGWAALTAVVDAVERRVFTKQIANAHAATSAMIERINGIVGMDPVHSRERGEQVLTSLAAEFV
jgi:hypothetical protein